jgi:DNA replication protein DnaC
MSNKLIIMSKVRNIIRLYTEGVSKSSISVRTGVPRNTVKKYIHLFLASGKDTKELELMSDAELEKMFLSMSPQQNKEDKLRYQQLEALFPEIEKALKRKENTREKVWQEYIKKYPDGYRLSQFKEHYRRWIRARNPVMHIEHKSGDKMYVDYAGEKLSIIDEQTGEEIQVEVFVSILGASQLTYVEATMTQQKEDFIGACENALYYYGGAPRAIVTDNLKAAVTRSNKYEPSLNEAFRDFVSHYTMAALPAGPYKPTHKALVEGAVKIIYRTIYGPVKQNIYTSLASLNRAILIALEAHNNKLMKGRLTSRRGMFEETERDTLQPLPLRRYDIKRNLDKNQMMRLGDCSFISRSENIIIIGSTGIGKSYIASAIGNQACTIGYKVLYANTYKLLSRLKMAKADGSYIKEIARIEKQDLLILDDFGLQPFDGNNRSALMEIIEDRHGKHSTIITSQVPVSHWYDLIGEQTIADALLDRIVHDAHRLELTGESLRKKQRIKSEEEIVINQ